MVTVVKTIGSDWNSEEREVFVCARCDGVCVRVVTCTVKKLPLALSLHSERDGRFINEWINNVDV